MSATTYNCITPLFNDGYPSHAADFAQRQGLERREKELDQDEEAEVEANAQKQRAAEAAVQAAQVQLERARKQQQEAARVSLFTESIYRVYL